MAAASSADNKTDAAVAAMTPAAAAVARENVRHARVRVRMPPLPPLPPLPATAAPRGAPDKSGSSSGGGGGGSVARSAPLPDHSGRAAWTPKSAPATLRAADVDDDEAAPACPQCRSARHVHKFRFWTSRGSWVWLCSAEPVGAHGQGTGFCGALFFQGADARCSTCRQRLRIESHMGHAWRRGSVPPLPLGCACASSPMGGAAASARSAGTTPTSASSTGSGRAAGPACPQCRSTATHRFRAWPDHPVLAGRRHDTPSSATPWVWLCSNDDGRCGHLFVDTEPDARCLACGQRLLLDIRRDWLDFYCPACQHKK